MTDEKTLAFLVRPDTLISISLDLGETEVRAAVYTLLQDIRAVGNGKIRNFAEIRYNLKTAQRLYHKLIAPLEDYIPDSSSLVIIPDGILHYLPFEALVTSIREEPSKPSERSWYKRWFSWLWNESTPLFRDYIRAQFLIEKYAISYAPSASVLDPNILHAKDRQKPSENLAIFASPAFGGASQDYFASLFSSAVSSMLSLVLMGPDNQWQFQPLPLTGRYARELTRKVKPSRLFIQREATEKIFKLEAGNHRFIHIATHAVTEERMPMYSCIVFAQNDDPDEDGLLHAYEIFDIPLNADLVTLTGCRTGLGKLSRGEGLIGLTRAFMYAGAPSVVVSLWAVEESSGLLMNYFYENIKQGMGKAEALRQAKLRMIKSYGELPDDGKEVSYAHPFLWAPFVLVGEPQ